MASIFTWTPVYLTVQDAKDSSIILSSFDDADLLKLILQAEDRVLNYLGYIVTEPAFNVAEVQKAVLYIAEHITVENTAIVKSESTGDRSRTYEVGKSSANWLPYTAIDILGWYRTNFYKQVI